MTKKDITQLFDSFSKLNVLVIGDVMVDAYLWGHVDRISPEAPVPVVIAGKKEYTLGGASNVLKNLHALGANPFICSVIGNDEYGIIFEKMIQELGLSPEGIIKSTDRITTCKLRIMGNKSQMIRVDEETTKPIQHADYKLLLNSINELLDKKNIHVIIFEDYDKGVISSQLIDEVVKKAQTLGIPVAVDPKKKHFMDYKHVSLFKPNLKEIRDGLNVEVNLEDITSLENAVNQLHEKNKIEIILTTLSEKGVYISQSGKEKYAELIPAHKRDITDVSGAGDTVISVAGLCLALNLHPKIIAVLSNLAGGLVCEKVGAVPIDKTLLMREANSFLSEF